jgi:hypothetical protein
MPEEPFKYRNPDGSLDLDAALGEDHVKHYTTMLEASPREFTAMQLAAGVVPDGDTAYSWREPATTVFPPSWALVDGYELDTLGSGPESCSSSVFLVLLPEIIWDVCGYYRTLGFHWTEFRQATARDIRLHYLTVDPRQEDTEAFYACQQLLDPDIRYTYDRQPLGGLFFGDRNVRLMLERMAAREASRINAEAHAEGCYEDEPVTQQDVLDKWGLDKSGVGAAEAKERLRRQRSAPEPGDGPSSVLGASLSRWDRRWIHYRLTAPGSSYWARETPSAAVLETWQALLCAVLSDRGVTVQFAVGIWPGPGPKVWRDSNNSCIFFVVNSGQPTRQMAYEAVEGFLAQKRQPEGNIVHAKLE